MDKFFEKLEDYYYNIELLLNNPDELDEEGKKHLQKICWISVVILYLLFIIIFGVATTWAMIIFGSVSVLIFTTTKKKLWKKLAIVSVLYILIANIFPWNNSKNTSVETSETKATTETTTTNNQPEKIEENAPSWVQGRWRCATPYGVMTAEISGNYIKTFDGENYDEGYFDYYNNSLHFRTRDGWAMYISLDHTSHRLVAGKGYYYTKQ